MRRLLSFCLLLVVSTSLFPARAVAQPQPDTSRASPGGGLVWGLRGGLVTLRGPFQETVGHRHGSFQGFVAVRSPSGFSVGIQLAGTELQKRSETVGLNSGLDVKLQTTTALTRLGIFGQYGPRFGAVRPYAEGLLGIHILNTSTTLPGDSNQPDNRKTHSESVAPAVGLALGVEVGLYALDIGSIALQLEGRRTHGGTVDYLYYSKAEGEFVRRSSGSSTSALSLGLVFNY
jgi:hypothetical protein